MKSRFVEYKKLRVFVLKLFIEWIVYRLWQERNRRNHGQGERKKKNIIGVIRRDIVDDRCSVLDPF